MPHPLTEQEIRQLAADKKTYERGLAYAVHQKVKLLNLDPQEGIIHAEVEGSHDYDVHLILDEKGSLHSYRCSCPAFEDYPGACKHVIAVLKTLQRQSFETERSAQLSRQSAMELMAVLARPQQDTPQEKITLDLTLDIAAYRQVSATFDLKIGLNRLYVVKNLQELLSARRTGKALEYGLKFTYDPNRHGLQDADQPLVQMLMEMLDQYEAVSILKGSYYTSPFTQKPFQLSSYHLSKLLDALGDKEFTLSVSSSRPSANSHPHPAQVIRQALPLDFSVKAQDQDLTLKVEGPLPVQLTPEGKYYLFNKEIYEATPPQQQILPQLLKTLTKRTDQSFLLPADQRDLFASEALPVIEQLGSVELEDFLADKFIREDLQAKIYFDRKGESGISARLEFHYGDLSLNPFLAWKENQGASPPGDHILIRDLPAERRILTIFEETDFTVSQGLISLEDDDKLFAFVTEGLPLLLQWAQTYYSEDFKLKLKATSGITGRVRMDESLDLLEISFQYGDIDPAELSAIFASMQKKKKYYRLQDGSFLDLRQPELTSMAQMLDYLNLSGQDLEKTTVQLPKFRAMYIDSFLRHKNLAGIQRNRAFKQLVQSILEPQDGEYEPPLALQTVLRDYQKTGFRWLKTLSAYGLGGILADDMGLGKTLQVLAFLSSLTPSTGDSPSPALVIAPTSLVYNWQAEAEKFTPDLRVQVIEGTPQERLEQFSAIHDKDLVVCSYAVLRRDIEHISPYPFSYCFLDEAQNIKNPQTLNAKSVQRIQARGYFALTGTPIENSLSELWSIFNFLMPSYLLSQQEFQSKFALPIAKGEAEPLEELSRQIRPFILRRLKKDVLKELPPKIETKLSAVLTEEQKKIYLAYLQQTKSQIAQELATSGFGRSQIKILAALTRLRQICSHPGMFIEDYAGESGKMQLFQEILADALSSGHRLLVFSQFTSMLDIIQEYLQKEKIEFFYLSGATKALDRSVMTQSFNGGQGQVFLISLKAGGTGLNLTGADMVIHFDPWWNPAVEDQATDRAHRIGQNQSVQVIRLITQGTIEEKVLVLQERKKQLIDAVIQPGETLLNKLTEDELKALFEMD